MQCRVCQSAATRPLWQDLDGCQWHRCGECGSDTSTAEYDPDQYGAAYVAGLVAGHEHNADLFECWGRVVASKPGRAFLDVGCGAGHAGAVMAARGWRCSNWDISAVGRPAGTLISPEFRADLFAAPPFDAVLCRAVLEHVPRPAELLAQLATAVSPSGLLQITTPRPLNSPDPFCYRREHLHLWHPVELLERLLGLGMAALYVETWEKGTRLVLCRPPAAFDAGASRVETGRQDRAAPVPAPR